MRVAVLAIVMVRLAVVEAGTLRSECFPVEKLPQVLRPKAEAALLETADSFALYTIVTGLKPMSAMFLSSLDRTFGGLRILNSDLPKLTVVQQRVDEFKTMVSALGCGDNLQAGICVNCDYFRGAETAFFAAPYLFHVPRFRKIIADHPDVYAPLGITPATEPVNVLYIIDRFDKLAFGFDVGVSPDIAPPLKDIARMLQAQRAKGLLYGYPLHAVRAHDEHMIQIWVDRKPFPSTPNGNVVIIPHHSGKGFRYYSPEASRDRAADEVIKQSAAKILSEYEKRRAQYIGPNKPGIVAMLRDWFCKDDKDCGPENVPIPSHQSPPAL